MTWVDVVARARGLAASGATDAALVAVDAARDRAAIAQALGAAGYPGVSRDPEVVELATRARAAAALAIVARWAGGRAGELAPLIDDEDRHSLRAILRGLVAGAPAARRLASAIPTPQLPEDALRALAAATTPAAALAVLSRRDHPFADALAGPLARAPLDLVAVELALAAAARRRGRRVHDPAMAAYVTQSIDAGNLTAAILLAGRGHGVDAAACFQPGGARLDRAAFLAAAAADPAEARRRLAVGFARTPVGHALAAGAPDAIELAVETWQLAAQARMRRTDPGCLAAVVHLVLRRRREARVVRRAAWRLAFGAPS